LNQSGVTVWSATYDAFGRATVDSASTVTNNLRYPGQYYDAESGLHYNWMRFYDPSVGRYTTWDPIGLRGGKNIYTYVYGNTLMYVDPYGLCISLSNNQINVIAAAVGGGAAGFASSGNFAGLLVGATLGGLSEYATQSTPLNNVGGKVGIGVVAGALNGGNRAAGALVGGLTAGSAASGNTGDWSNTTSGLAGGVMGGGVAGLLSKGPRHQVITMSGKAGWAGLVGGFFQDFTLALLKANQCRGGGDCGQ